MLLIRMLAIAGGVHARQSDLFFWGFSLVVTTSTTLT
jgi:hypothetical protein